MKKYFTLALLLSVIGVNAFAQNHYPPSGSANKTLSNLTNPTSVNQSLIPASAGSKDLGSSPADWKDLYLSGAIYLNGGKFINNPVSGGGNTAIGWQVLNSVTTGYANTGVGYRALYSDTGGQGYTFTFNTATGWGALYSNTSGFNNTATGFSALYSNMDGYENTATGFSALYSNADGYYNTATGEFALYSNTHGDYNSADGEEALRLNTTGSDNVANGFAALYENTNGNGNTANGSAALYLNNGNNNTADGYLAGSNITGGSNNTFLGYNANSGSTGNGNNMMALGNGATVTASNHVVVGNSLVTSIGGYVNWSNLSDGRVKKNIQQNVPGLAFINKLQPITYNLDLDASDKIINCPAIKDKDGKVIPPSQEELDARKAKEQIVYTGFVAQDVEKAAQSLNYDFSGVDKPDNDNTLYALRYSDFVMPLVKAVQDLSQQHDNKNAKIDDLQKQINELKAEISGQQSGINNEVSAVSGEVSGMSGSEAILYQNTPNPISQNTTIQFYIPSSASDAMITVSDLSGKTIQQFNHLTSGNGIIAIATDALICGTYQYSLVIGGKITDTKQLIVLK